MLGLLGRMVLLRFLPRRLIPLLTAYELFRFVRGRRAATPTGTPANPQVTPGGRARVGR